MLMISFITASIGLAALVLALVYCSRRPNRADVAFVLLAGASWLLALRIGVTGFSWQTGTALHRWFKQFSLVAGFLAMALIPLSAIAFTLPRRRAGKPRISLLAAFMISSILFAAVLLSLFPFMKPIADVVLEQPEVTWVAACALVAFVALAALAQDREGLKKDGSLAVAFSLAALSPVYAALPTLFRLLALDPDYLPLILSSGFSLAIFAASPGIMRRDAARGAPQASPSTPLPASASASSAATPEAASEPVTHEPRASVESGARVAAIRSETPLSARESEIAALLAEGKTNGEIAELLFISQKTVETHLSNIFRKMRVSNRVQLVRALLAPAPEKINT
ncbi:MAG TPA: helix-turn-helix transcriptional regulator [Treponemataceae bacterium]|nr:helix-turn-helix transcriptional regulator [Treponemataceae bacterium]